MTGESDRRFMLAAIAEAQKAREQGEVPIGAVAVREGQVIARGHNRRIALSDVTAHAEMMCLRDLSSSLGLEFDLADVTVYSTLEPCAMCAGAMIHHRVGRCLWGEQDLLLGADGSAMNILSAHGVSSRGGLLRSECRRLLLDFFEEQLGRKSCSWEDIRLPEDS